MKVAVLSGKGGTGKTFVSVNLSEVGKPSTYIDCDVEEPNGYLFFDLMKPKNWGVTVKVPKIDYEKCNGCRACIEFCQFNALAYINDQVVVFEDICHSCGGCKIVCTEDAVLEYDKEIGQVGAGEADGVKVYSGTLNIGEASGIPIIDKLLAFKEENDLTVIDCPPGSACSVIESIKDADYCLLVTEPTIFGLHNLKMVYNLVTLFNKKHGVVLNKCFEADNLVEAYCKENEIQVLAKIPFDIELGKRNSEGAIIVRENDHYRQVFEGLYKSLKREVWR